MTESLREKKLRGLDERTFKTAYGHGQEDYNIHAQDVNGDEDILGHDVDWYQAQYMNRHGLGSTSPLANAWMDGWVNEDSDATEFLADDFQQ